MPVDTPPCCSPRPSSPLDAILRQGIDRAADPAVREWFRRLRDGEATSSTEAERLVASARVVVEQPA